MSDQRTDVKELTASNELLAFGAFELDPETGELRRSGRRVKLQDQPARLLHFLASRQGELVRREEIRELLWEEGLHVDHEQGINACVRQIRRALGDRAVDSRFLETVPRKGYRFIAPVEEIPRGPVAAAPREGTEEAPSPPELPPGALGEGAGPGTGGRLRTLLVLGLALGAGLAGAWLGLGRLPGIAVSGAESAPVDGVSGPGTRSPLKPRLLVLPLRAPDGGEGAEAAALGLSHQLITRLVRDHGSELGVIARTTASAYRGTEKSLPEIVSELEVGWVLAGSVRSEGEQVRITLRLLGADQVHRWANEYHQGMETARLEDLELDSTVLDVVSRVVAYHLDLSLPTLSGRSEAALRRPRSEAYRAFLDGFYWLRRNHGRSPDRALVEFQRAVELEPGFAPAWLGLASARLRGGGDPGTGEDGLADRWEAARSALLRVSELDSSSPHAHQMLAAVRFYWDWDVEGAGESLTRALELAPEFAEAHRDMAAYWSATGRHSKALNEVRRAFSLDPFSPRVTADLGWYAYFARRPQEALERCRESVSAFPDYLWARECATLAAWTLGDLEEVRRLAIEGLGGRGGNEDLREQLVAEADPSRAVEAFLRWNLSRLEEAWQDGVPGVASQVAVRQMMLGDQEATLLWLERAVEKHRGWILPFLPVYPLFDPVRADPRFETLVRRVSGEKGLEISRQALDLREARFPTNS